MKSQKASECNRMGCLGKEKKQTLTFVSGVVSEVMYCVSCGRVYRKKQNYILLPLTTADGESIYYFSPYKTIVLRRP